MANDFRNEQKSEKKKNWEKLKFPFVLPFKQFFFRGGEAISCKYERRSYREKK